MNTVLLVSNRRPGDAGGRAEKLAARQAQLERRGWRVVICHASEPYVRSFPGSVRRGIKQVRSEDVDVVHSINNPFHLHMIGFLVSLLTGTPWVAELRDPISSHPDRESHSPVTWASKVAERIVVTHADRVVWFDGIQLPDDYFERRYDLPSDRVQQLPPMGYDAEAFESGEASSFDDFVITYAGSFYEGWIEPYGFLEGFGRYLDRPDSDPLRAQFYGDWTDDYETAATEAGVADSVTTHEFVPHEEIVPVLKGSDVLLYVGGTDQGNRLNLPSKLWDYVGARQPILALVDTSFRVAEFVEDNGLGIAVDPRDSAAVADAIARLRSGEYRHDPDPTVFEEYTRSRSADRIADVLDAVSGR